MADTEKLDTLQSVELAEGVEIRLRMAGPMLRAGAYLIDFLIRGAVLLVGGIAVSFAGIAIGQTVVEAKTELEKIREQVQNVERPDRDEPRQHAGERRCYSARIPNTTIPAIADHTAFPWR